MQKEIKAKTDEKIKERHQSIKKKLEDTNFGDKGMPMIEYNKIKAKEAAKEQQQKDKDDR